MNKQVLGTGTRIGYGVAEMGTAASELMIQLYLLKFFVEVVGLDPAWAAGALAMAVGVDAITDVLMGRLSDRTSPPGGRRRLYILLGGLLLAATLPLLFHNPQLSGTLPRAIYLFCAYVAVNTAMTVISVPHAAFGGELSADPKVRTQLYAYRLLFGTVGLLLGTIVPGLVLARMKSAAAAGGTALAGNSIFLAALLVAAATITSALVTFFLTRGRDHGAPAVVPTSALPQPGFLSDLAGSIRDALKNKVFLPLLGAFFIATLGRTMNASIALLYYIHFLKLPEQDVSVYVLGLFVLVMCLSIPAWVAFSNRFGKKWPAFGGALALGLMTVSSYPFFPEQSLTGPLLAAILGGFLAASVLLYDALVADIVDHDALRAGEYREGLFFGFWKMAAKLARLGGLAGVGLALSWAGLEPGGGEQSPETAFRLSILFGPGVGSLFIGGALLFAFMPWSNEIHERVRRLLQRKGLSSPDG